MLVAGRKKRRKLTSLIPHHYEGNGLLNQLNVIFNCCDRHRDQSLTKLIMFLGRRLKKKSKSLALYFKNATSQISAVNRNVHKNKVHI